MKQAAKLLSEISGPSTKLGDLRRIAKEIKRDHALALDLWSSEHYHARLLAILIMDKKRITPEFIDQFEADLSRYELDRKNQLTDWFLANQLTKDKQLISLIETWEDSSSAMKRRIFWYYQARLRWMGKTNHSNTEALLSAIESRLAGEAPEVQWAMNYTAGQIGKWQEKYRARCIAIGKKTGLYKDEVVPKNCTPNYLPEFIRIEAAKIST